MPSAISSGVIGVSPLKAAMEIRLRMMSVQPSLTRSSSWWPPEVRTLKFSRRRRCQPGSSAAAQSGSVGRLPRRSTDDGVRWKT